MRKPLNSLLKKFGYEIVRISKFAELLESYYDRAPDFTFVQVGANDGILFDTLYQFVTARKCRGIVIEPMPDFFERLVLNYRNFPNIKPIRCAVHPALTKCKLYRIDPARLNECPPWAAGIASLDPNHHKKSKKISSDLIIEEEVDAFPLMDLIKNAGLDHIDLLQTDTEGFDAEVIKMIDFEKASPSIIKYERVSLSAADQTATGLLLKNRGYRLFEERGDTIAVLSR
jgi:FkbM family methyltransferase